MNKILEKLELIDIWRKINRDKKEYTFFSAAHGTFTKIDHVPGHRKMANKRNREEIINATFSDHNAIKIIISKGIWIGKSKINWKLNNMILQDQLKNKSYKQEELHLDENKGCKWAGMTSLF